MQIGNNCIFLSCKLSHRAHLNLYRLYIHPHLLTTLHHPQSTSTLISSSITSPSVHIHPHLLTNLHHPQSTSTVISSSITSPSVHIHPHLLTNLHHPQSTSTVISSPITYPQSTSPHHFTSPVLNSHNNLSSELLSKAERNYRIARRELLAVVLVTFSRHFRP